MTEFFRRRIIKLFEYNNLINPDFAKNLLSWKNSGLYPGTHFFFFRPASFP